MFNWIISFSIGILVGQEVDLPKLRPYFEATLVKIVSLVNDIIENSKK